MGQSIAPSNGDGKVRSQRAQSAGVNRQYISDADRIRASRPAKQVGELIPQANGVGHFPDVSDVDSTRRRSLDAILWLPFLAKVGIEADDGTVCQN